MERVNPASGEALEPIDEDDAAAVEAALADASDAFEDWRDVPTSRRQSLLGDAASVLRENADDYAATMTEEMGKPLAAARSEVEKCAWACDYYAERAGEHLQDERVGVEPNAEAFVTYEPLGPILAVMPWNFPFWQVFRFAAPHLTAGNVGLLKHASNVPACAQAIEDVFREAGYPDGVFQTLLVGSDAVDDLIRDERVRAVTLTGSERAGRAARRRRARPSRSPSSNSAGAIRSSSSTTPTWRRPPRPVRGPGRSTPGSRASRRSASSSTSPSTGRSSTRSSRRWSR